MTKYTVKGHQIEGKVTKSGYDRKAVMFANNIIDELKKLEIPRHQIEVKTTGIIGNKNLPATLEFWAGGHYLRFSYSMTKRFIDNLYIIMKVVELEVQEVLDGKKDLHGFYHTFAEDGNRKEIAKELIQAKKDLGLDEDEQDLELIEKTYKKLARSSHPDLGGSLEEFQKVNKAHKLIKKHMGL